MAITLTESAKLRQNPLEAGLIELFPRTSPVLALLPFQNVAGNSYTYNRENTLPDPAFRTYNSEYSASTFSNTPVTENLKILGGISKTDRALVKTQGNLNDLRSLQDASFAKAMALDFTKAFFKGDSTVDANSFDGLQKRIAGDQKIDNGTDVLDITKLDDLIDSVYGGADALFMNKSMHRKVMYQSRALEGVYQTLTSEFGKPMGAYAGVPIYTIEDDSDGNAILGFTEGDGSNETSIYACKFGYDGVIGLQAGDMEIIDNGLQSVYYETLIEWITTFTIKNLKCASRLHGITLS